MELFSHFKTAHRERAKKRKKEEHRGETDARRTKKKESSAQPGARTQDLSLTIPECFWCLLLGERSNQLVKYCLSIVEALGKFRVLPELVEL